MKKIVVLFVVLSFLSVNVSAYADMGGYMKGILNQIENLTPNTYHMQQRGFFVGGTMKIPNQGVTIHPLSITLPNFKTNGCGGINGYLGGFSYLNFDALVQKMQQIIQAAPALAFQIALSVLSEKLTGSANFLESVTDAINNININSCSAMNGIVKNVSNAITNIGNKASQDSVNKQANGGSDSYSTAFANLFTNPQQAVNDMWSKFKNDFNANQVEQAKKEYGISNSLLTQAADDIGGLPSDFIDMMRYYVGDVLPVDNSSSGVPSQMLTVYPPCGANATPQGFIEDLTHSAIHELSIDELKANSCEGSTVMENVGLVDEIKTDMEQIYNALLTNTNITDPKLVNLINMSPIPIYSFLSQAALVGGGGDLAAQLAQPVADAIVAKEAAYFLHIVRAAAANQAMTMHIASTKEAIRSVQDYEKYLSTFESALWGQYYNSLKKAASIYGNFMDEYKMYKQEVDNLLNRFKFKASYNFTKGMTAR